MAEQKVDYDVDDQLERTVDWLKYAETKNGVLVTLLSALLVAFFQQDKLPIWSIYGKIVSASLILGILLMLYSFFPILTGFHKIQWLKRKKIYLYRKARRKGKKGAPAKFPFKNSNLHFYGAIAAMSAEHFIHAVRLNYGESSNRKHFLDVCQQIKVNSDIAVRKFKMFKLAGYLCFISFIALVLTA